MSLKFLNKKEFHPGNLTNQKRVWIAEQKAKEKEQSEKLAAAEVRKLAETQHYQQLAATKGDVHAARRLDAQQVGFMYAPPPGFDKKSAATKDTDIDDGDIAEDDAARAFRRKLERSTKSAQSDDKREAQRTLERYVGRRPDEHLTIKTQVERFPMLKNAPVEGEYTDTVKVNFNPVGVRLRNVKCMRCNAWGHQSGDRECEMRDANPHDAARQLREDPMAQLAQTKRELVLRKASLPLEMQEDAGNEEFAILLSDDDDFEQAQQLMAQQSTAVKRRRSHRSRTSHRSRHQRRRRSISSSSSASDTSASDASSDRSDRKRHAKKATKKRKKKAERHEKKASRSHDTKQRRTRNEKDDDDDDERKGTSRSERRSSAQVREHQRTRSRSRERVRHKKPRSRSHSRDRRHDR